MEQNKDDDKETTSQNKEQARRKRARRARKEREQALRDLGLVKVRGNLGGTYWE